MKCDYCGQYNGDEDKCCWACGAPVYARPTYTGKDVQFSYRFAGTSTATIISPELGERYTIPLKQE